MQGIETAVGLMAIETALPEELPVVMGVLDECAAWLHSKGIAQWRSPQPPHDWERMKAQIALGNVSLARLESDRSVVGTLRTEWEDPLWPEDSAVAGYVHALAICNRVRGHQLGERLLEGAEGQIADRDRKYIRLDCWDKNPVLQRYYERLGFRHCGNFEISGWTGALYEKEALSSKQ